MDKEYFMAGLFVAQDEINKLLRDFSEVKNDDTFFDPWIFGVYFLNIQGAINNAWYSRNVPSEIMDRLSEDENMEYFSLIPNFCRRFEFDKDWEIEIEDEDVIKDAFQFFLYEAKANIDDLGEKSVEGQLDDILMDSIKMGALFLEIQKSLCCAWYFRHLSMERVYAMKEDVYNKYAFLIPNFQSMFEFDKDFNASIDISRN